MKIVEEYDWTSGSKTRLAVLKDEGGGVVARISGRDSVMIATVGSLFLGDQKKTGHFSIDGPCDERLYHVLEDGRQVAACGTRELAERVRNALALMSMNHELGRHLSETLLRCMQLEEENRRLREEKERRERQSSFSFT